MPEFDQSLIRVGATIAKGPAHTPATHIVLHSLRDTIDDNTNSVAFGAIVEGRFVVDDREWIYEIGDMSTTSCGTSHAHAMRNLLQTLGTGVEWTLKRLKCQGHLVPL
jgi:hypothetical protein